MQPNSDATRSMRQLWFDHVRKIRKRIGTKKEPCPHRKAMSVASTSWPKEKAKIERKRARERKKLGHKPPGYEKVESKPN